MKTIDSVPWRKSSYSGTNAGDCVEAADMSGRIPVRRSEMVRLAAR
jgi:hypothetical protein